MPDSRKSPRLQFLDVGLINYKTGIQREMVKLDDLTDLYRGRIAEQAVGQEFMATDTGLDCRPIFWVRDKTQSQAEVDFILQFGRDVVPVEIKSGKAGKLRSLHEFMIRADAPLAVRLYAGKSFLQDVSSDGSSYKLLNMPYYAAGIIGKYIEYALSL